jgi:membrane-bound lytic murein transglycosylase D
MRAAGDFRVPAGIVIAGLAFLSASCATINRPQAFRTFLLPPPVQASRQEPVLDPPNLQPDYFANEAPFLTDAATLSFVSPPEPSDTDFVIKQADDRFAAGKQALSDGRPQDARKEFNRAIEVLLAADTADRTRIERRLEELSDRIYRYDLDELGASESSDQVSYDRAPMDGILEMTFPVDPSMRSKVIEQIRATASQLPLDANDDSVIGAINFFTSTRGKKIVAAGLRRQGRYKAMIERVLAEEGLPQELIFVAQEESGFLPRAKSNKSCVGMWQFAAFRGKEYGLEQTASTDDRMDPEKATRAAAHHLHDLYDHFGDWYLAIAAYDCGPGCIDHAVMRTGYADFWKLRKLNVLPKETANYVPVILAMTIISKNAKDYGLDDLEPEPPLEYDTIELQSPTHLSLVADAVDRPLSEIKELNPAVLRSVAPAGYRLHVPKGTGETLETAFRIIPENRRDSWRLHRVSTGDTFASLAQRYKAQTALLSSANHGEMPEVGQWAAVPVAYPGDRSVHPAPSTAKRTSGKRVRTVAKGTHAVKGSAAKASAAKSAPAKASTVRKPARKSTAKPVTKSAAHRSTPRAASANDSGRF